MERLSTSGVLLIAARVIFAVALGSAARPCTGQDYGPSSRTYPASRPISERVFYGRVVGQGRFPSAGAVVELRVFEHEPVRTQTDAEGRFRLEAHDVSLGPLREATILARCDGRIGVRRLSEKLLRTEYDGRRLDEPLDVGTIVLDASFDLTVRVVDVYGVVVPGAVVAVFSHGISSGFREGAVTDATGRALLRCLLDAELPHMIEATAAYADGRYGAKWSDRVGTELTELEVVLKPTRTEIIRVVDHVSGAPLSGVALKIAGPYHRAKDGVSDYQPHWGGVRKSDAEGFVRIEDVPMGWRPQLDYSARGFSRPTSARGSSDASDPGELRLVRSPRRVLKLVAGDATAPVDGEILTAPSRLGSSDDSPSVFIVHDGSIEIEADD